MMVISSPLSDFLALWSSHGQVKNRPRGADSADPYYQILLLSVARGSGCSSPPRPSPAVCCGRPRMCQFARRGSLRAFLPALRRRFFSRLFSAGVRARAPAPAAPCCTLAQSWASSMLKKSAPPVESPSISAASWCRSSCAAASKAREFVTPALPLGASGRREHSTGHGAVSLCARTGSTGAAFRFRRAPARAVERAGAGSVSAGAVGPSPCDTGACARVQSASVRRRAEGGDGTLVCSTPNGPGRACRNRSLRRLRCPRDKSGCRPVSSSLARVSMRCSGERLLFVLSCAEAGIGFFFVWRHCAHDAGTRSGVDRVAHAGWALTASHARSVALVQGARHATAPVVPAGASGPGHARDGRLAATVADTWPCRRSGLAAREPECDAR